MTEKERLEKFLEENPDMKSFQRLIEKRLEGVSDPLERYQIIFGMMLGNLEILKDQNEDFINLFKLNLIKGK